jgi:hypothetical protein
MPTAETRTFSPEFEQESYDRLWTMSTEDRAHERDRVDGLTNKNLETLLAERFNVLVSRFTYDFKNGQLWGENMNEPAIESFKRGRDLRKLIGNPVDFPREDAEILGFEKIEQMLREEKDVLSISPRGGADSTYQHNFYDVFRWTKGRVEARRYSSALGISDYQKLLGTSHNSAEEFLANPIDISSVFKSADQVHAFLHRDHEATSEGVFENYILPGTAAARQQILRAFYDGDESAQEFWLNAYLNAADEINEWAKGIKEDDLYVSQPEFSGEDYDRLGNQTVRQVSTGCGSSGGFKKSKNSPYSVSEFGKGEGKWYTCPNPNCNYEANGPVGNKCPECGLTKEKQAENSEEVC